jgi:hypothetical protein
MSRLLHTNNPGEFDSLKRLREKLEVKTSHKKELKDREDKRVKKEIIKENEEGELLKNEIGVENMPIVDRAEFTTSSKEGFPDELDLKKKQIDQLVSLFKKNKVIKNSATVQFIKDIFEELPPKLIDDMSDVYNDVELLKMKYG